MFLPDEAEWLLAETLSCVGGVVDSWVSVWGLVFGLWVVVLGVDHLRFLIGGFMRTVHSFVGAEGDEIVLNEGVCVYELVLRPYPEAELSAIVHLTYEQAVQIRDGIDKVTEKLRRAVRDGVPVNSIVALPDDFGRGA